MSQKAVRAALKTFADGFCQKCDCTTPRNAKGQCKPCRAALQRAWIAANPEKKKAMDKAYSDHNKEKIKAYKAAYHLANIDKAREKYAKWRAKSGNPEKAAERSRAWYAENPGRAKIAGRLWASRNTLKAKAIRSKWTKANPEYHRAKEHTRRARKVRAGGKHTANDVKKILRLQRQRCGVCHASLRAGYHIDHVMPLALGGSNGPGNLQMLCPSCNARKHAKHPVDFMQENGFLL